MAHTRVAGACALIAIAATLAPWPAEAGSRDLKRALADVRKALSAKDSGALEESLTRVLSEDHRKAVPGLLGLLQSLKEGTGAGLYWQVVGAATSSGDSKALRRLADWLLKHDDSPLARDLLFGLRNNRHEGVLEVYEELLGARRCSLKRVVCDRLSEQTRPEAVDLLLETLEDEHGSGSALERRVRLALVGLVGEDLGDLVNWQGWWAQQRDGFFADGGAERQGETGTVVDDMDASRRGALTTLSRGGKVLVLKGEVKNFDSIETMLERLGVQHQVLTKRVFMQDMDSALDGTAVVILNCSFFGRLCRCKTCKPAVSAGTRLPTCGGCDVHDLSSEGLSAEAVARIKDFVKTGGSVFTEDYGLQELTEKAWPEYVRAGKQLSAQQVDYAPVPGRTDSPLLRGVLAQPGGALRSVVGRVSAEWKVDDLSRAVHVVDEALTHVLLSSEALAQGAGDGAVAVTFSPGATATEAPVQGSRRRRSRSSSRRRAQRGSSAAQPGIVLHVLSHFGKQRSQQDEFTLQNLLVNFLLEAQERYAQARR